MPDNVQIWMVVAFVGLLLAAVIWAGVRSFCGDPSTTYQPDQTQPVDRSYEAIEPVRDSNPSALTMFTHGMKIEVRFGEIRGEPSANPPWPAPVERAPSPLMEAVAAEVRGFWSYTAVAGVEHDNRDGTSRQRTIEQLDTGDELVLCPEPDNPVDPNAVRVETSTGKQIGYLPRKVAARTVAQIANGQAFRAVIDTVEGPKGCRRVMAAVLSFDRAWMQRPESERAFELKMDEAKGLLGGHWSYVQLTGVKKRNPDGSDRRDHMRRLAMFASLQLVVDVDAVTVTVTDQGGCVLGMLEKHIAREIIAGQAKGTRYSLTFRSCSESVATGFQPFLALVRHSPDLPPGISIPS